MSKRVRTASPIRQSQLRERRCIINRYASMRDTRTQYSSFVSVQPDSMHLSSRFRGGFLRELSREEGTGAIEMRLGKFITRFFRRARNFLHSEPSAQHLCDVHLTRGRSGFRGILTAAREKG